MFLYISFTMHLTQQLTWHYYYYYYYSMALQPISGLGLLLRGSVILHL
jgi:hypothetical protein